MQTKGLGRGLSSLFSDTEEAYENAQAVGETVRRLPLGALYPNPDQPRKAFDEKALGDLADSIREHGVIVPILAVDDGKGRYRIVAGERRYRAAGLAGLETVPVLVRSCSDEEVDEIALIENLQREDLNPIEAAAAMKRLMDEYGLTQEELSVKIGKSRPAVANTLRLLSLPAEVVAYVREGLLSPGHARALLTLGEPDQKELAALAIKEGYSVRKTERAANERRKKSPALPKKQKKEEKIVAPTAEPSAEQSVELRELISRLRMAFKTKVTCVGSDDRGKITIEYYTRDDLDRLSEMLDFLERRR